ncbi:UNVERIFIED_CONTAM: hypothetical protein Sindi_0410700, partial [Sesamum indicum]
MSSVTVTRGSVLLLRQGRKVRSVAYLLLSHALAILIMAKGVLGLFSFEINHDEGVSSFWDTSDFDLAHEKLRSLMC